MAKNLITLGIDRIDDIDITSNVKAFNANKVKLFGTTNIDTSQLSFNTYTSIKGLSPSFFKQEIKIANQSSMPVIVNIMDKITSGVLSYYKTDFSYHMFGHYNNHNIRAYHELGFKYFIIFPKDYKITDIHLSKDFPKYTFTKYIYHNTLVHRMNKGILSFIPYEESFLLDIIDKHTVYYSSPIHGTDSFKSLNTVAIKLNVQNPIVIKDGFAIVEE